LIGCPPGAKTLVPFLGSEKKGNVRRFFLSEKGLSPNLSHESFHLEGPRTLFSRASTHLFSKLPTTRCSVRDNVSQRPSFPARGGFWQFSQFSAGPHALEFGLTAPSCLSFFRKTTVKTRFQQGASYFFLFFPCCFLLSTPSSPCLPFQFCGPNCRSPEGGNPLT